MLKIQILFTQGFYKKHLILKVSLLFLIFALVVGSVFFISQWNQKNDESIIRSDLIVPSESVLLHRADLLEQIHAKFKNQKDTQTVVLVGPGGAGKTTLARLYVHQEKDSIIWEINAETIETLRSSFEKLAKLLSKTEIDKKALKCSLDIKEGKEREIQIISFVKSKLKLNSSWFLIYDNVENFSDIQNFFPQDNQTWGNGKIIATTRDSNILNNKYLDHVVYVKHLNSSEKLNLFSKIMKHGNLVPRGTYDFQDLGIFLENIPSFPLDVSIAAHYLKVTGISHKTYLDNLSQNNQDFEKAQENILKESGGYAKTRNDIITLALQHLIYVHKDFKDLLLLVCLLDSQNIPIDLLETYKESTVVDNFIHHLKKYSLIMDDPLNSPLRRSFSMHRSTQAISFTYLVKHLDLYNDIKRMNRISDLFSNYIRNIIDEEDFYKIEVFLSHCKLFMKHSDILSDHAKILVGLKLAELYFNRGNYQNTEIILNETLLALGKDNHKNFNQFGEAYLLLGMLHRETGKHDLSKECLEKSLSIYRKYKSKNYTETAKGLAYLGYLYRDLGNFKKARELLDESIKLYKNYASKQSLKIAHLLVFQGVVYRELGEYEKAREILKESLFICDTKLPKDHFMRVWPLVFLGSVYRELGLHDEGRVLIEKGLEICKKWLPKNHINLAGTFIYLGDVYNQLERYSEAKKFFENGLDIYTQQVPDHPIYIAWASGHLGTTLTKLKKFDEAEKCFKKALVDFKIHYKSDSTELAWIYLEMGRMSLDKNCYEDAKNYITLASEIYKSHNHPKVIESLEAFADLYSSKAKKGVSQKRFIEKTRGYLKRALAFDWLYFSKISPYRKRLLRKLNETMHVK